MCAQYVVGVFVWSGEGVIGVGVCGRGGGVCVVGVCVCGRGLCACACMC